MTDQDQERQLLRRRALGWGLRCDEIAPGADLGRDLALARGPNGLDFLRVEGMENLGQDLSVALTTALGSDLFNVEFGFDGLNALVEESNPFLVRERMRIAVIQLLRKDPRVRRILHVALDEGEPEAPQLRQLHIRVAFETISGDQATVDLGKVVPHG